MEIDVSITASDDVGGLNFNNIYLSLNDSDSSIDSLLSGIESDSNDSSDASTENGDGSPKLSKCFKPSKIIDSFSEVNDFFIASNGKSGFKARSLSFEGILNVNLLSSTQISEDIKVSSPNCKKGKRRNSNDSVVTSCSKHSEKKFKDSKLTSIPCSNLCSELNVRNQQFDNRSLKLDKSFQGKNILLGNNSTCMDTIISDHIVSDTTYVSKNLQPSLLLNYPSDINKNLPNENHELGGIVLNTEFNCTENTHEPSSHARSSMTSENAKYLLKDNPKGLPSACTKLKLSSDKPINKITGKTVKNSDNNKVRKPKNKNNIDQGKNVPKYNLCKSLNQLNSHSNHLSDELVKSNKELISFPINQNLVLCTKENELQIASIQSFTHNEIVIESSKIAEGQSNMKKIRQVFPTKVTKSKLSHLMDDLDSSLGNSHKNIPNKKLKENNFGAVELPNIHSGSEAKSKSNLLINNDSHESFKRKSKSHSPTCHGSFLTEYKTKNINYDVEQKYHNINDTLNKNHDHDSLLNIPSTHGPINVNKNVVFDVQRKGSTKEQFPLICEVNCNKKENEIVDILKYDDQIEILNLNSSSHKLNIANNNIVLYHDANGSSEIGNENVQIESKICSIPCTPIVGKISPIMSGKSICDSAKKGIPRLHSPKSDQRCSFQNKSINNLAIMDCKAVGKVAKIIPNYSKDLIDPTLNLSQETLKEKLGLVVKSKKSSLTHKYLNKSKRNNNLTKKHEELHNVVPPDKLQKLIDLFELVMLSKNHLGFLSMIIEALLSESKKCKDSNSVIIFDTLAEKSTISIFKMCSFILEKTKQSLLPGPKMDNVELSIKAVESILNMTDLNSNLNVNFVANATKGMSAVEIFLFTQTIIECKSLPVPNLEDLQPFCDNVMSLTSILSEPEKVCNVGKVPELLTLECRRLTNEEDIAIIENKLSGICDTSMAKHNVNDKNSAIYVKPPVIEKSLNQNVISKKRLVKTPLNAKPISSYQNIPSINVNNNIIKEKTYAQVSVSSSFTREQVEKVVSNFFCFDENIQSAIKGYLQELSQTAENAEYACRLLNTIKKNS